VPDGNGTCPKGNILFNSTDTYCSKSNVYFVVVIVVIVVMSCHLNVFTSHTPEHIILYVKYRISCFKSPAANELFV